jgi:hypothetical protein
MDLLRLAPDIQEAVLDLLLVERSRALLRERDLWRVAAEPLWVEQRRMWREAPQKQRPQEKADLDAAMSVARTAYLAGK